VFTGDIHRYVRSATTDDGTSTQPRHRKHVTDGDPRIRLGGCRSLSRSGSGSQGRSEALRGDPGADLEPSRPVLACIREDRTDGRTDLPTMSPDRSGSASITYVDLPMALTWDLGSSPHSCLQCQRHEHTGTAVELAARCMVPDGGQAGHLQVRRPGGR